MGSYITSAVLHHITLAVSTAGECCNNNVVFKHKFLNLLTKLKDGHNSQHSLTYYICRQIFPNYETPSSTNLNNQHPQIGRPAPMGMGEGVDANMTASMRQLRESHEMYTNNSVHNTFCVFSGYTYNVVTRVTSLTVLLLST